MVYGLGKGETSPLFTRVCLRSGKETSTLGLIPSPKMHMVVKEIGVLGAHIGGPKLLGQSQFAGVFLRKDAWGACKMFKSHKA